MSEQTVTCSTYDEAISEMDRLQQAGNITGLPHVVSDPVLRVAWAVEYRPKNDISNTATTLVTTPDKLQETDNGRA